MDQIVGKHPNYLFSTEHMPCAGITPTNLELTWFANDTEARYDQHPHPSLTAKDISYRFNAQGYRCEEFELSASRENSIKVVSIGASEVFGCGVPEDQSFPAVFSQRVEETTGRSVVNWNLGVSGGSSDFMSRVLFSALPILKPDMVLMVFPYASRREYINDADRLFIYGSAAEQDTKKNKFLKKIFDPENAKVNSAYQTLASEYSDHINLFKNYQVCEALCQKHNVMWLYSTFIGSRLTPLKHVINNEHLVLPGIADLRDTCLQQKDDPAICWARDMGHPGVKPHQLMADLFYRRLYELYPTQLEALRQ